MRAYVPVYMYSHQSGGITCENWPTDFLFGGFLFVCFFFGFFFWKMASGKHARVEKIIDIGLEKLMEKG